MADAGGPGVSDHGELDGLDDDDHQQYASEHGDLSNVSASQHHSRPTGTQSEEIVGGWTESYDLSREEIGIAPLMVDGIRVASSDDNENTIGVIGPNGGPTFSEVGNGDSFNFPAQEVDGLSHSHDSAGSSISLELHAVLLPPHSHVI